MGAHRLSHPQVPPGTNQLLNAVPRKERLAVMAACEPVELVLGETLAEKGARLSYAWFPTASFISLIMPMTEGSQLEVGLIGDEGMFGVSLLLGVNASPSHALVQGAGSALRISGAALRREIKQAPHLERVLKRYIYVMLGQQGQAAACVRFHLLAARLARWLLMTRDRAHAESFPITQEFLAYILGVRRVGVTKAACSLQAQGLIRYHRGAMVIVDGKGLERVACECYHEDKMTYAQQLG
jgi:CRP-like cAMP-binding protein